MGSCGAFNTHGAGCRFTVIRTDPDVDSVSVVFGVRATDGDDIYAANASQVVLVTFGAPTTSGGVGTTSVEEGSVPPPICAEVAPQQRAYPLEVGRLVDEVLVQTYAASSHSRTGRAVVLAADGSGVLHVGLVIDRREHNPCTDGRIDDLTYRLEVSGREGDRGNLAVRPALFVNDDVFIAAPLSITNGAGVNDVLVLTPADFSPLQGSPILDLVSGPPVRFGLVAGVPCPQTSTCGAIERGLTVDLLEIVVNEGTSTP
jgi:hypothetical protein